LDRSGGRYSGSGILHLHLGHDRPKLGLHEQAHALHHFIGRKGDGHPGPKALWEGLMKLMAYVEALQTVHEVYGTAATCG